MDQNNIWRFSRTAYKQGVFEDLLGVLGGMLKPGMSMLEILTAMEDWAATADIEAIDALYERMEPLLGSMAQEEVMRAIKTLLDTWMPLIEKFGGLYAVMHLAKGVKPLAQANLAALRTIIRAALPFVPAFLSAGGTLSRKAGVLMGEQISQACTSLNRAYANDPQNVQAFFTALFGAIDPQAFGKTAVIVTGTILDQRPPLVRWSLKTAAGRLRKRFLG